MRPESADSQMDGRVLRESNAMVQHGSTRRTCSEAAGASTAGEEHSQRVVGLAHVALLWMQEES